MARHEHVSHIWTCHCTSPDPEIRAGNTEREWNTTYDIRFKRRESQQGVDAMKQWRAGMLERADQQAMVVGGADEEAAELELEL